MFDHDGDGVKTGTGWVKPDDGWLVLDRNGNGAIDSGRELFGVDTLKSNGQLATDGFDALKDMDANQDGKIDSADSVFASLRIWRDLNQDGISQAGELTTLSANSITAIGVSSTAARTDLGNGNVQTAAGTFIRSSGTVGTTAETSGATGNLDLLVNTFYSQFTNHIALTEQAMALPGLHGSGRVRDLSEAISLSSDLGNWVQTYIGQTTRQGQVGKLDGFIQKWADTSDLKTLKAQADALSANGVTLTYNLAGLTAGTPAYDEFVQKLGVVERFMGFTYGGANGQARFTALDAASGNLTVTLAAEQIASISLAYDRFKTDIYESLLLQTRLSGYCDKLDIAVVNGQVVLDFQPLETAFKQAIAASPQDGIIDLVEFVSAAGETRLKSLDWNATDFLITQLNNSPDLSAFSEELSSWTVRFAAPDEHKLIGTSRLDLLVGTSGADTILGGDGNDIILGKSGADSIEGGNGNDTLDGGEGDDTITDTSGTNILKGGAGNDTLTGTGTFEGGLGDDALISSDYVNGSYWSNADTYVFNAGDGRDTIGEYGRQEVKDTLRFGAGIEAGAVRLQRSGDNMVFKVSDTDQVTVLHWFSSSYYQIEQVQFADGTAWGTSQLLAMPVEINGTAGADTLVGGSENNVIDGGAGDDSITDTSGTNILKGGAGNDTITGTGTFEGGLGDDALISSDYVNGSYWSNADTYVFNAGDGRDTIGEYGRQEVTDTLRFGVGIDAGAVRLQRSGDNMVFKVSDTDQVTVLHWFSSSYYQIEQVQFADGTAWGTSQMLVMPVEVNGTAGADTLVGGSENNVIDGGAGDDTIDSGAGNDTIDGGAGNDIITSTSGTNILKGGAGNDTITGTGTFEGGLGDDALVSSDYVNGSYWSNADTYVFNAGDGRDTISEYGRQEVKDTLRFGVGIDAGAVRLQRSGDNMVFKVSDTDQVTVLHWFSSQYYQIEQVQFADGTRWDLAAIQANVLTDLNGTESADTLNGTASSDNIIGLAGDDILNGLAGNDIMTGGSGNDTYVLGRGYGADTVQENDATAGNTDILQFLSGIASDQIWLRQASNDLEVSIIGTTDKVTLTNWYLGSQYHVEQFKTSDGKTLLDSQVQNLVSAMAAFAPPAAGQTTLAANYATALAPVMAANWQ